uniref:Uncharacterized protein n=1 Tax=Arundo donax TaxID=35708 RepID=A0A0A9EYV5_ARUDO
MLRWERRYCNNLSIITNLVYLEQANSLVMILLFF